MPLIAALLGIPTGERHALPEMTPQRQKQRTLEVLVDQLEGLSAGAAVLLTYEDVHWIDPTTQELLGLVIERIQRLPVLALITFRPEFTPPWSGQPHVSTLALDSTRPPRRCGDGGPGGRSQGAAGRDRQAHRGQDRRRAAVRRGADQDGARVGPAADAGDHFELAGPLPPLAIPATLHDSLLARLDRLAPVKEIAQIGAALGREFSARAARRGRRPVRSRSSRPPSTSWSHPSSSSAAAHSPRRPTASSTPWSRTPPTAPCSSPAASSSTPASSRSSKIGFLRRLMLNPSFSPITVPRPTSSKRLSASGTRPGARQWRARPWSKPRRN